METTTGGHVTKLSDLPYTVYDNGSMDAGDNAYDKDEPLSKMELYLIMGILSFLAVVGTAGNAIVLYVFSKKKDRLVSTLFILALAFVDFTTCLIVMPYTVVMECLYFQCRYDIVCKMYQFLITSNIPFSALIMVAIAIDRYLCICHPFLHALNLQRAKIVIAVLALCAVGLGLCVCLMYGVYQSYTLHGVPPNDTMLSGMMGNLTANATDAASGMDTGRYHVLTLLQHSTNFSSKHQKLQKVFMTQQIVRYTGECMPNQIILSSNFQWYFQKFYTAIYLVCLIIVIVLYTLIYKSVLERRSRRMKQKSRSLPMVVQAVADRDTICDSQEETLLTTVNGDTSASGVDKSVSTTTDKNPSSATSGTSAGGVKPAPAPAAGKNNNKQLAKEKEKAEKARRKSTKKDRNHIANLKTAAMLFVVTVVFIVTYFPAFMMALNLIPNNVIIFYLYFANNVANPVIYSFMNKNFRDDCRKLFCRR